MRRSIAFIFIPFLVPAACGGESGPQGETGGSSSSSSSSSSSASSSGATCTVSCCEPASKPAPESCGLNGRGTQDYLCPESTWTLDECVDPDECTDGKKVTKGTCGPNQSGASVDHCVSGNWQNKCEGADVCTNGTTKAGTEACGFDGHYQQLCAGGVWTDTATCVSPASSEDAQLLSQEAAHTLSFQCFSPALTVAEMTQHFPDGAARWTPDNQVRSSAATVIITRYTRSCNMVTGCSAWSYIVGSGDEFYLGYALDTAGNAYLWQGKSEPPGYKEFYLPVTSGMTTATLSTDELNFTEPQRFLVKVTDTCLSLSTIVHATAPDATGKWTESVYGALEQWTWPADPHPTPEPIPAMDPAACPATATTTAALASAWLSPGQSQKYLGFDFWDISQERDCTPYTGCAPWSTDSSGFDPLLKVVGTGLTLTIDAQTFTVKPDGTFGDTTTWGFMTPTCTHIWHQKLTPNAGGLAGGNEVAQERVISVTP